MDEQQSAETKRVRRGCPNVIGDSSDGNFTKKGTNALADGGANAAAVPLSSSSYEEALREVGAWTCGACGNQNFASRAVCRSTTCDEARPPAPLLCEARTVVTATVATKAATTTTTSSSIRSGARHTATRRHDPATSKTTVWPAAASPARVRDNQRLRGMYATRDNNPDQLTVEEVERARILVARDERKRLKKTLRVAHSATTENETETPGEQPTDVTLDQQHLPGSGRAPLSSETNGDAGGGGGGSSSAKRTNAAQYTRNKALRQRVAQGQTLSSDEQCRYQLLQSRDERKKQQRSREQHSVCSKVVVAPITE